MFSSSTAACSEYGRLWSRMVKFTITYQRKVQVRLYEMLTIGLSEEFDTSQYSPEICFPVVQDLVDRWIEEELRRLRSS